MPVRNYAVGIYKRAKTPWRCKTCGGLVATVGCVVCYHRAIMARGQNNILEQKRKVGAARVAAAREANKPQPGRHGPTERGGPPRDLTSVSRVATAKTTATKAKARKKKARKTKKEADKVKIDCVGHIKTLKLKRELNIPRWQAVGLLETLFNFAMVNADDGGIGRYSNDEISLYMEYFGDADELISALTKSGFIEECKQHRLKLHDWAEHAPKFLKDRLAKRALAKGSEPERTDATESDIEQPDANDARCSVEIGLSKVKDINATSLKSNPSSGESWEIDPGDTPTDEMLLQLIADWNEVAAKHPRRITQRRSKQITPKLRRQVSQLPDDWFSRYREALAQLPVPCFDYDGGFRANFDWFVQPDKRERTVAYNIIDGVYDFVPADAKDAREKQLDRQNQAAQKKRRGQMDRETMLYRQIQALIRTGKADSAECERLKKEYAEVCDRS